MEVAQSVLVPNRSFLHQGGKQKQRQSFATVVKTTTAAQGQQGTTHTRRSSTESGKSRLEKVAKPSFKRDLPNSANKSLEVTQEKSAVKSDDRPIFAAEMVTVKKPKLSTKAKHKIRRAKLVEIENDCFYWLLEEFAFVPRTNATLRDMKVKLTKYLNKFDMRGYTTQQRYQLVVDLVGLAMHVPKEEQAIRQSLKDSEVLETMHKQNLLLNEGNVGNTRPMSNLFMRKAHKLDTE